MKPTAHDAAAVSEETKKVISDLEYIAGGLFSDGYIDFARDLRNAIDRLIILDNAAQARQPATDPRVIKFTESEARSLLEDSAS